MAQVKFIKQEQPDRIQLICHLTERFFQELEAKEPILILVEDEAQALALDQYLWTWDKGAFLPHVYDNGAVECCQEPIVISTREDNCNAAAMLIMGRPCSLDFVKKFRLAVDFAEVYDAGLVQHARQRFRVFREHGLNPEMLEI